MLQSTAKPTQIHRRLLRNYGRHHRHLHCFRRPKMAANDSLPSSPLPPPPRRRTRRSVVPCLVTRRRLTRRDLQLCVGRRCLVFQLLRSDSVPKLLRRFLLNPNNTFVGMWNHSDLRRLLNSKHALYLSREPLDLNAVLRNNGMSVRNPSREMIVSECLGSHRRVVYDELINVSDRGGEELSKGQILQACLDAYTSFLIGKDMNAWDLWYESL